MTILCGIKPATFSLRQDQTNQQLHTIFAARWNSGFSNDNVVPENKDKKFLEENLKSISYKIWV